MTGIALYRPSKIGNFDSIVRVAYNFNVDFICTIENRYKRGAADTVNVLKQTPVFHFNNVSEFFDNSPQECIKIALELVDGAFELEKFTHPRNAIYIFGGELPKDRIPDNFLDKCPVKLKIKSNQCLNLAMCAGITLFHRNLNTQKYGQLHSL